MENYHKINTKIILAFVALVVCGTLQARSVGNNGNKLGGTTPTPTAGCSPATALAVLEFNNVRARIEATGGSMFQDRANSIAAYNVPKQVSETDPLYTAIFSGALWLGGKDLNGNLKVAAVTFRSNGENDFWPGPLDSDGEVNSTTCEVFDQYFGISRPMVNEFVSWFNDKSSNPGYQIPAAILNYPAKGNTVKKKQQTYAVLEELAPFFDKDGDGFYNPATGGDYPKYDLIGDIDCRATRDPRLFGDTTMWFVFNDKGNTHSETQGASIGMEIRGQAFAFATNDEINNMTFYNYTLVNKSSFTFTDTYFGQWIDADLGNAGDDFVGCDASRGLGYCYNGDNNDENANGITGYGSTPPAIGVDFFEGPYADNDGIDNPLTTVITGPAGALALNGIPYAGLGIGYGDGIIDNERYGMKKFVYYSIGNGAFAGDGDPQNAVQYYNYLRGIWRDGSQMVWGGNGYPPQGSNVAADLLFPGDSDPLFWSTQGVPVTPATWSESGVGNTPGDRRFLESAGPFTLYPGAVNDLTVGVIYARALSGDNTASLTYLKVADDKAQALFDNCFKVLDGPNAPDIAIQELNNELILFLSNNNPISNNYKEGAYLKDPFISIPDTLDGVYQGTQTERDTLKYYKFQGYQIYQVKNSNVSVSELEDPSLSRLIYQVDVEDDIAQIVNYDFNDIVGANVPKEMVNGKNLGISHSFRITEDAFATGTNKKLVNHKTYHFMAIAYGYNNWKTVDPQRYEAGGQLRPYLPSRTNSTGGSIRAYSGVPHSSTPLNNGTVLHSEYGDQPEITRIEGSGNGGLVMSFTSATESQIVSSNFVDYPVYDAGAGPIDVKVIDPLNVKKGTYYLQLTDSTLSGGTSLNDAYWRLINGNEIIYSERTIQARNEQIFSNLGFSITMRQTSAPGVDYTGNNGYLTSGVSYVDPTKRWLSGAFDYDSENDLNWIHSGTQVYTGAGELYSDYVLGGKPIDPDQRFEDILRGTWSPYRLSACIVQSLNKSIGIVKTAPGIAIPVRLGNGLIKYGSTVETSLSSMDKSQSVDIVFTNDQSKWTRCVVFETGNDTLLNEGGELMFNKRKALNVGKNGAIDGTNDPIGNTGYGMGWFPGYAINIETGERLNMAFGEDSGNPSENGRDMLWNPTQNHFKFNFLAGQIDTVFGGKHFTYVFNTRYDQGRTLDSLMSYPRGTSPVSTHLKNIVNYVAGSAMWVGIPLVQNGESLLSTDARLSIRVTTPYKTFQTVHSANPSPTGNSKRPMYMFSMDNFAAETGVESAAKLVLDMIKAVPNPYYAYSEYETDKLDNRIKITNLPEKCTISIYNVNGTLMRRYVKASSITSLDWDLKNHAGIPVAGGVYLIHVEIPDVGETVIKWFGVARPTDLNGL